MHVESYQKNLHLEVPKYFSSVLDYSYKFFNKNLIEILLTNGWRQSFAKLPILKLNLHTRAAFCLRQKLRGDFPENVTSWHYKLASLHFKMAVAEYVTTNVTAMPIAFLHETNYDCILLSLTCAIVNVKLSLFQENDLSYHFIGTTVYKHQWYHNQNQWCHTKLCFNFNLAMCNI